MRHFRYKQSNFDHMLVLKRRSKNGIVLIIYVDNMIITGDNLEEIERLKKVYLLQNLR